MPLSIASTGRHVMTAAGQPMFLLGDTAWQMFHKLTFAEIDEYLRVRAEQGFNTVMSILGGYVPLDRPNAEGERLFHDLDPEKPNEAYFRHIDRVLDRAAELGLICCVLPIWGDRVQPWEDAAEGVLDPKYRDQGVETAKRKAFAYGKWVASRYKDRENLVFMNGGDRGPSGKIKPQMGQEYWDVWNALGEGLRAGDGGRHLIGYHAPGAFSSSYWFHHTSWLDFNSLQSGHWQRDIDNYAMLQADYHRLPTRPTLDSEPCYENHMVQYRPELGKFDAYDVRKAAWRAAFAGAFGHIYGAHEVFQFHVPGDRAFFGGSCHWREALNFPGARQMVHVRRLIESRPMLGLVPDNTLVLSHPASGTDATYAMRHEFGSYAYVYSSSGAAFVIDLNKLTGDRVRATWYSPRTGETHDAGQFERKHSASAFLRPNAVGFAPPSCDEGDWPTVSKRASWLAKTGNDWVLQLEVA